jgi:hypothetical protein
LGRGKPRIEGWMQFIFLAVSLSSCGRGYFLNFDIVFDYCGRKYVSVDNSVYDMRMIEFVCKYSDMEVLMDDQIIRSEKKSLC